MFELLVKAFLQVVRLLLPLRGTMTRSFIFFLFFFCFRSFISQAEATDGTQKIHYSLVNDPIDVVIVAHAKDQGTIDLCIQGIKENSINKVRRVIVVSKKRLTKKAEWFPEKKFPFSRDEVAVEICRGDEQLAETFFAGHKRQPGWYFQQLLKLYSPFIIPRISSNVLVIDADTIFLNPVTFLNSVYGGQFCVSHHPAKRRYIAHAQRVVPGYQRVHREVYSVCHHMLFQKPILDDLFKTVENHHQLPFWKVFCNNVSLETKKGASEYEIYYNFALRHTDQVELRELRWANSGDLSKMQEFKDRGYHFVSFHTYLRKKVETPKIQVVEQG